MTGIYQRLRARAKRIASDGRFSEILVGSAWALPSRIFGTLLSLICSVIVGRVYGAEALGVVALITSFLALAMIPAIFGTNTSILRIVPEHVSRYSFTSAFKAFCKIQYLVIGISLAFSALFIAGADLIAAKVFGKPELTSYFRLAAMFGLFQSLLTLNMQASRSLKLVRTFAVMQFLQQALNLLLLLLLGIVSRNISVPVYALLGSTALAAIASVPIVYRAFKAKMQPGDSIQPVSTKAILALSLPMLVSSGVASVVDQASVIILGVFRSAAEVGYFSLAMRFATLTTFMLAAINSIAAPKFAELFHSGRIDELLYVAKKSTKLIFWSTTPILLCLIFLGRPVIRLFYGPGFLEAYGAMLILVIGQFVNSISGATGNFMNMTGEHITYQNVMLIAASTSILLNVLLVPKFGIKGAAWAGAVCLIIWNVYILVFIKRKYGRTIGYIPLMGAWVKPS